MSEQVHSYQSLLNVSEGEYREKGSKFLAYAWPANTLAQIKAQLESIAEQHPKSRHVCYAYRIGTDGNNFRANDDGEPSGSAGKPILGQLDAFEITNCAVAVVRYFGGVKLGVPGLINAYRTAAAEAIKDNQIVEHELTASYYLKFDYNSISDVERIIRQTGAEVLQREYGDRLIFTAEVKLREARAFAEAFTEMHLIELEQIEAQDSRED